MLSVQTKRTRTANIKISRTKKRRFSLLLRSADVRRYAQGRGLGRDPKGNVGLKRRSFPRRPRGFGAGGIAHPRQRHHVAMPLANEGTHELADPVLDKERLIALRLGTTQIRATNQPVHTNTTTSTILTASDAANISSNNHRSRRLMTAPRPWISPSFASRPAPTCQRSTPTAHRWPAGRAGRVDRSMRRSKSKPDSRCTAARTR